MILFPITRNYGARQLGLNMRSISCKCHHPKPVSRQANNLRSTGRRQLHTVTLTKSIGKNEPIFRTDRVVSSISKTSRGFRVAGAVGLGLGLGLTTSYLRQTVALCEPSPKPAVSAGTNASPNVPPNAYDPDTPLPSPTSIANPYELTFGTVCGICAGVFIKKGLKAAAFLLGGIFVLLQYFNKLSWIKVDWGVAENRFKQTFYTTEVDGRRNPPTIQTAFQWLLNFIMADFQPRASFVVGVLLGLRVG
ncbi:hypothetical protein FRB91_009015 [Serendipita sp. 411]|nr:hypothetical protein FRC16_000703 [Serendipita sp. 398]KAG8850499.1 hypothetical protein FRB91_009015 [Serendipita sp. 411]